MGRGIIFINNDSDDEIEAVNPNIFRIFIDEYPRQDCQRLAAKLYFDSGIAVDYNKIIRQALDFYLKNHVQEKELAEMESIKKEKAQKIEAERKAKIPKFDWDLANRKDKK